MSKDKGIFEPQEGFASPPKSPFSVDDGPENPFAAPSGGSKSPFSVDEDEPATRLTSDDDKGSEPFASGQGKSPFGYEPPVAGFGDSPFKEADEPKASSDSPFADSAPEPAKESSESNAPFGDPAPAATPAPAPAASAPAPAPAPAPTPAPASAVESESTAIRQLELRAIFGVDRELSESEILQRSRSLPGIRNLGRVSSADAGAVEAIKRVIGGLGFGDGAVTLYAGKAPVDFIREGSVLLAVQTDGSFAPGVRETLILVARELGRM
ncbi:hypothetical protein HAHE_32550 [Haloferula helveola]|uniref:Roadblock/LAMTOR2 domain-containing protein n=1 Tax=Haloferula helveola TaxID=490095 RepID=A0ABM7RCG0_9BACT|nr:hypothetical protein HAHE_32550 [Haloferula helveola]